MKRLGTNGYQYEPGFARVSKFYVGI